MLSVIGAVLVAGGSAAAGFFAAHRLSCRCRVLSAFLSALDFIEAEIVCRLSPLPEIIAALATEARPPVGGFFSRMLKNYESMRDERPFSAIWADSLDATPELDLSLEELRLMKELGGALGRYGADEQRQLIEYTRRRLRSLLDGAEKERERQSRMYGILGVAGGIAAVIILI